LNGDPGLAIVALVFPTHCRGASGRRTRRAPKLEPESGHDSLDQRLVVDARRRGAGIDCACDGDAAQRGRSDFAAAYIALRQCGMSNRSRLVVRRQWCAGRRHRDDYRWDMDVPNDRQLEYVGVHGQFWVNRLQSAEASTPAVLTAHDPFSSRRFRPASLVSSHPVVLVAVIVAMAGGCAPAATPSTRRA